MSNTRRPRSRSRARGTLRDQLAAVRPVLVDVQVSDNLAAILRVAAAANRRRAEESTPDKQETPEVGPSKVSTDRSSSSEGLRSGCSPDSA